MEKHLKSRIKEVFDTFIKNGHFPQFIEMELTEVRPDYASATFRFNKGTVSANRMNQLITLYCIEYLSCEIASTNYGRQAEIAYSTIHLLAPTIFGNTLYVQIKELRRAKYITSFGFDIKDQKKQLLANGSYDLELKENT